MIVIFHGEPTLEYSKILRSIQQGECLIMQQQLELQQEGPEGPKGQVVQ